ncbi:type II toxin-antitoxin system ParD family antitoxin [Novosphingobium sp. Chol11]|uniref:ribbon-helix-helix domain-containing protein n=1 Tax=Novosphingobium sp. Chol11 TaxID=1385763 RepID=UPI0025DE58BD|nr:type II toxin-antitoxin system ParD family antitoxin [Novosphingobium sp. Chol11]
MTDLSFSLPSALQNWIEQQIALGHYADAGDYLRDLIRRHRAEAEDVARVRALIEEGEASGYLDAEPEAIIEEIIAERRARRG